MNSFTKRLLTGAFILAVIAGAFALKILVSPLFMDALILFISVMALIEVGRAITPKLSRPLYLIVFAHLACSYALILIGRHTEWLVPGSRYSTLLYTSIELPSVFIVMLVSAFFFKAPPKTAEAAGETRIQKGLPNIVSTAFLLFYPTLLLIFMLSLNNIAPVSGTGSGDLRSVFGMIILFAVSFGSDTFAYLIGMTFKGPKLCPNLSPKKTISGAVGGLLGGVIGAMIGFLLFKYLLAGVADGKDIQIYHYIVMGVVGSVFTQCGDLAASFIKRFCEIKDYSNVFPGHGGFMDRLDGLIFNSIFVYFYLMVILI
ncbi:phosphatidate cytidylyltransferase [Clostridia bacterium]|nr:phosphatidate cytidylyltransferase [Clostridia bacterium]